MSLTNDKDNNFKVTCDFCNYSHYLNQCPEFGKLDVKEKYDFVSKKQLCRNCLHKGHISTKCKKNSLCKHCKSKHNTILHDFSYVPGRIQKSQNEAKPESEPVSEQSVMTVSKGEHGVAGISCVEVLVEGKEAIYKCKAIVDQKSSVNLCSKRLASKLKLSSSPFQTTFSVATGKYPVNGNMVDSMKVFSDDMANCVLATDVLILDSIPLSMGSMYSQNDIDGLEHLKGIRVPKCSDKDEIDLLIGSGVPKAFHQIEERKGGDGEIYAVRLTLGWDFVGPKRVFLGTIHHVHPSLHQILQISFSLAIPTYLFPKF
jgi:hypothetical protein